MSECDEQKQAKKSLEVVGFYFKKLTASVWKQVPVFCLLENDEIKV